jgi:hypothetical protein
VNTKRDFEMATYVRDMLAERAALQRQVWELQVELEIAQQMARRQNNLGETA